MISASALERLLAARAGSMTERLGGLFEDVRRAADADDVRAREARPG